jgi:hypothetical protein
VLAAGSLPDEANGYNRLGPPVVLSFRAVTG